MTFFKALGYFMAIDLLFLVMEYLSPLISWSVISNLNT